ncbi:MAG TPA: hypothetical protein VLX58_13280 [Bryobacteraceae bacterium]|nr:hypothetical protein [Bryobacteraceae bacterium]
MPKISKLAELRAKTDQELVKIIDDRLDLELRMASRIQVQSGAAKSRAEKSCREVSKLLSKVEDPEERRRLHQKFARLREALGDSATSKPTLQAAGFPF